jgi:hypothetical protein
MKQIYRPAKILSHFVHYSIATTALAKYYADFDSAAEYDDVGSSYRDYNEIFLDELTEGVLLHAKSVLPHETMTRTATCRNASRHACEVGHECPDEVVFEDEIHRDNLFHDSRGKYCNCWVDDHVERYWVPLLEAELTKYA